MDIVSIFTLFFMLKVVIIKPMETIITEEIC